MRSPYDANGLSDSFGMFSRTLPTESQLMLGSGLDTHDPLTAMFMAGSNRNPNMQSYYDPSLNFKNQGGLNNGIHPSFDGINATLAPSALDLSPAVSSSLEDGASLSSTASSLLPPGFGTKQMGGSGAGMSMGMLSGAGFADDSLGMLKQNCPPAQLTRANSTQGSGGAEDWGSFLEEGTWE